MSPLQREQGDRASDQPLVSFIVLAYRQEQFIREAVQSAFAQTYERMEIIVSDDASPDKTFQIVEEEAKHYRGSHRVILNRSPKNLGLAENLNRAVQLASGDLIVLQGGDDISFPDRTSKLVQRWISSQPRCELIYSDVIRIAVDGTVLPQQLPPLPMATVEQVIRGNRFLAGGCAAAYSRTLFEKYGPLRPNVQYEDYVLTFRALLGSGCSYIDEPLVYYRVHNASITQSAAQSRTTRLAGARWAKHAEAEAEERLRAWDLSGKSNPVLRRRLARDVAHAKLHLSSSNGSRLNAVRCVFRAIATVRPRAAWTLLCRDVLLMDG